MAFKPGGVFESIRKDKSFISRLISVVSDKAHLITGWVSFHLELGEGGHLRNMFSDSIPSLLPSATMPEDVLARTIRSMSLHHEQLHIIGAPTTV